MPMAEPASPPVDGVKQYLKGTHRLIPPEATLRRLTPLLPVFGITRVADLTRLDRIGIPVVQAVRPNSRSLAVSQGKGADLNAAKVSALMESIETFHAESIDLPMRLASFEDLCRRETMASVETMAQTETGFDPAERTFWIPVDDILNATSVLAPVEAFHTDFTLPTLPGSGMFQCDTNGLASGNSYGEALLHGLCEVIERDAETLWNLSPTNNQDATALDLSNGLSEDCEYLLHLIKQALLDVHVWELTTDIGLPVFQCLLIGPDSEQADPEFGFGCHTSRDVALARALTEAAQVRLTMIAGSRDDLITSDYDTEIRDARRLAAHELAKRATRRPKSFVNCPDFRNETVAEDIDLVLGKLAAIGVTEILCADLTRSTFNIPVVRTVIPGLEGAWEGFDSAGMLSDRALMAQEDRL